MTSLLLLKIILCARQHPNFIRDLTFWLFFHLWLLWGKCTLGARGSSSAVPVSVKASAYGRRCVGLRPTPKIPRRKREKPLVPRIREMWILPIMSTIWRHNDGNYVIISIRFSPGALPITAHTEKLCPKGVPSSMLQVYWRVRISSDEVHKRVGKSVLAVCKRT